MATLLKQSTAVDIALGPFVDSVDGVTAETGLTISQADVRLKKNNGNWAQANESTSASHEENGWYEKPLDATDTNTLGILMVAVNESGALPVWREFMVVPANVYDSLVGGSDVLQVDVSQFGNSNGTFSGGRPEVNTTHAAGTAWGAGAITAASIATGAIDADALAADASTEINTAVLAVLEHGTYGNAAIQSAVGALALTMSDMGTDIADLHDRGFHMLFTTIETLASQTSFTITAGSTVNTAYPVGSMVIVTDNGSEVQKCVGFISAYTGSTKTITLLADPGIFTMAVGDYVTIIPFPALRPATAGRTAVVDSAGLIDANMVKAGPTGSGTAQTAGDIIGDTNDIQARLPAALGANGNIKADVRDYGGTAGTFSSGRPEVNTTHWGGTAVASAALNTNVTQISGDTTAADNLEALLDGTGGVTLVASAFTLTTPIASRLADSVTHGGSAAVLQCERIVAASTTTNEPGIKATGNGTAAGILATGGATGDGIKGSGGGTGGHGFYGIGTGASKDGFRAEGGTSGHGFHGIATTGDGMRLAPSVSGHGLNLIAVGASKHGLLATGGSSGTSDGIKGAAGTGGVDLRGQLAPNAIDNITTTAPTAAASNFREMVVQTWRRFFKKHVRTATHIKTYADNGSTEITSQAHDSTGNTQTVESA